MNVFTDPVSNRPEQIEDAVRAIGRSDLRLRVFKAVYRGKKATKSVSEIAASEDLTSKQVLEAGKPLARAGVFSQENNGGVCYRKIDSVTHSRDTILRCVANPSLLEKMPTKRRPAISARGEIFSAPRVSRRRSTKARGAQTPTDDATWKLAMLLASPIGQNPVDVSLEAREVGIEKAKADNGKAFDIKLYPAANADSLTSALNAYQPDIIHFSGHGGNSAILMDNDSIEYEGGKSVRLDIVARLLKTAKKRPKLVFLNACDTAKGADVLIEVADVVIAMSDSIPDSAAYYYSRRFYAALFEGLSVKDAHEQAAAILAIDDPKGASLPQILSLPEIDPSKVTFQ